MNRTVEISNTSRCDPVALRDASDGVKLPRISKVGSGGPLVALFAAVATAQNVVAGRALEPLKSCGVLQRTRGKACMKSHCTLPRSVRDVRGGTARAVPSDGASADRLTDRTGVSQTRPRTPASETARRGRWSGRCHRP